MIQTKVYLTLNVPDPYNGLQGKPIIASFDPLTLKFFKYRTLEDWEDRLSSAQTEEDKLLMKLEVDKLHILLDTFIPEDNDPEGAEADD